MRHKVIIGRLTLPSLAIALLVPSCRGNDDADDGEQEVGASGFTSGADGNDVGGTTGGSTGDPADTGTTTDAPPDPGTDDGEPSAPPGEGEELCDAGNEAWVKRAIPFIQGRKPASIREVRVLVQMIEQLDDLGQDGRYVVARGLARGDLYLDRWKTYLYEKLRVNRAGDRRNDACYDIIGPHAATTDLAAFIRDNTADIAYPGGPWRVADAVYSALRLDDISVAFRADLFGRMSAPLVAGNVSAIELEEMRRATFGTNFEISYLGRTTECNECHRTEEATTWDANPALNRHWPIPGNKETAVYGPNITLADRNRSFAVFRVFNFAYSQEYWAFDNFPGDAVQAWGSAPECGAFRIATTGPDLLDHEPYMISDYADGDHTVFELDQQLTAGFEALRETGLVLGAQDAIDPPMAAAYLIAMNTANHAWAEAMGFGLRVANNFPRNPAQRDIMQALADAFVDEGFSLRALVSEIAVHDYFNQAPPARCNASTPYHLPAVFEPFSKSSTDPAARGNGVGDSIHRHGAWVVLDSLAQAMWWNKPDRFGPDLGQIAEFNCGGDMPTSPCIEEPQDATVLRDLGAFLSDSDSGFEGTDLVTLLRLEANFATGEDPQMHGRCTGPLGQPCAPSDWIEQLIDTANAAGATMWGRRRRRQRPPDHRTRDRRRSGTSGPRRSHGCRPDCHSRRRRYDRGRGSGPKARWDAGEHTAVPTRRCRTSRPECRTGPDLGRPRNVDRRPVRGAGPVHPRQHRRWLSVWLSLRWRRHPDLRLTQPAQPNRLQPPPAGTHNSGTTEEDHA